MSTPVGRYAKRVVLYFWPKVEADALVLDIWRLIPQGERPQDVFRRAVLLGLREMAANGELPEKVLSRDRIGERLARRLPAAFMPPVSQHPYPAPAPYPPALQPAHDPRAIAPPPSAHLPGAVTFEPAEVTFEDAEDAEPDIDLMMSIMGGSAPMTRADADA